MSCTDNIPERIATTVANLRGCVPGSDFYKISGSFRGNWPKNKLWDGSPQRNPRSAAAPHSTKSMCQTFSSLGDSVYRMKVLMTHEVHPKIQLLMIQLSVIPKRVCHFSDLQMHRIRLVV